MVKKFILKFSEEEKSEDNIEQLLESNKKIHDVLTNHKNQITEYYQNKTWDKFKKLSNEYELIFTTPNTGYNISKYVPVSRSFFKLWEILNDFHDEIFIENNMRCMFLAEGPGAFAESFLKYRSKYKDECYGMTLKSNNNKNIPDWRIDNINITYGADGTGNLYNLDNILYLVKNVGANSLDFITADGGFDFSLDFNNQENQSFRLLLSEILAAICLQKKDGKFILKIFDIFNKETIKMLHLLKEYYKNIYIIKPCTSRPCNSEKYLLCTGFNISKKNEKLKNFLIHTIKDFNNDNIQKLLDNISYVPYILNQIVLYNTYYSLRQIYYIERTIGYINKYKNNFYNDQVKQILDKHRIKSIKWCKKYGLEYN